MREAGLNIPQLEKLDARVPAWLDERLEERDCPFCSLHNQPMVIRPDGLSVVYCQSCSAWYVSPVPGEEDLASLYGTYWTKVRPHSLSKGAARRMRVEARVGRRYAPWLDHLEDLLGDLRGKNIVDVGCGTGGAMLLLEREGARVVGVDISEEACAFVGQRLGMEVHAGLLEDAGFAESSVDIVLMRDLLEHPLNPLGVFRTAVAILRPGGLLLIHTPNGGCADHTSPDIGWVGFRVDLEHLQYASERTVRRLAQEHGLQIEHLETFGSPSLNRIDELPELSMRRLGYRCKQAIKSSPGALRLIDVFRRARRSSVGGSPESGNYFLLTIMRKQGGDYTCT